MKIALIQPPIRDFYETSIRTQPIGLAYLAASLKMNGDDVEILDCREKKRASIQIPPELSYLRDFYPFDDRSPFKLYSGFYHFGMGWREIRQKVEAWDADVFGISSSFTPYHQEALEVARIIKAFDRRKIVVMGGAHVSCAPESVLESPWVDYIVLGEGEIRFPLLLKQIEKGSQGGLDEIDGIGYRKDGNIRVTPLRTFIDPLDKLPTPARGLFPPDRYRIRGLPSTMILTSRGCPHRCAYCSGHLLMGPTFRTRSPEEILSEMVDCQNRYGTRIFDIEDDNFTFDRERAKGLMQLIIKTFGERNLELTAMNGVSSASLDGELLRLMRKAGFNTVNLSFVSAEPATRERMGRPQTEESFGDILRDVETAGLGAIAYAIFGMPGQTVDEMVNTLVYLAGNRALVGPSIYYPTPGTPLFQRCEAEGLLPSHPSQWRSTAFPIETKDFSRLDIVTLFRLARVINFVKGKIDRKILEEGLTWEGLYRFTENHAREETWVLDEGKVEATAPPGDDSVNWIKLLKRLFEKRSFFSLRKDPTGKALVIKERSSKGVLDYFFEKAWEKPILKSR